MSILEIHATVNVITKKNPSLVSAALSSSYLGEPWSMFGCILRSRTSQYTNYHEPFKLQQLIALIYSWDCGESLICGDERLDNTLTPPKFEKSSIFTCLQLYAIYSVLLYILCIRKTKTSLSKFISQFKHRLGQLIQFTFKFLTIRPS